MSDIARKIDPTLLSKVRRYGAFDITACFNCGNCTAVCQLSDEHGSFPRKMIRSGQVGIRENLLNGPEAWLCYYCGECSETCPREAEPGEFMAALRRYVIAETDPTGLAKVFYRSPPVLMFGTVAIGILLSLFLVNARNGFTQGPHWMFSDLVAYEAVHWAGVILGAASFLILLAGVLRLVNRQLSHVGGISFFLKKKPGQIFSAAREVLGEVFTMKRHAECKTASQTVNPWYFTPRYIHGFILWGFLGLATATAADYFLMYILGTNIFIPGRIIGTVSGLVMLFGVSVAIGKRFAGKEKHSRFTHASDAWLLTFLFVLAVTGFWLEAAVTFGKQGLLPNWILVIHAVFAMELILLVALTKLGHAIYRPISVYLHILKQKGV